jgi:hypothetical protein
MLEDHPTIVCTVCIGKSKKIGTPVTGRGWLDAENPILSKTIGSQMAARLPALRDGRALLPRNIFYLYGIHFC